MRSFTESFFKLHQAPTPFLLVNVHDPLSVLLAQSQGAVAIGTSSAALAWSLGYADGEQLPVAALLDAVKRLLRVSQLPLTIDLESGYSSNPDDVADLVLQLAQSGVAGINLEDGVAPPELLCQKIIACRAKLAGYPLFINARTDVFFATTRRYRCAQHSDVPTTTSGLPDRGSGWRFYPRLILFSDHRENKQRCDVAN